MRRVLPSLASAGIVGLGVFWWVTAPDRLPDDAVAGLSADVAHGEQVFWASGCSSCHAAPDATGDEKLLLAGGQKFPSDFGTFIAPNISPDPENGIGGWSTLDLANAMTRGVSPEGAHYYPAFPYTSYANADLQDIVDLKAFLDTLPAVPTPSQAHEVGFPFNIRRSLGGWKFLFADKGWVITDGLTPETERGRYLVEALGHCGECHTPRNGLGGMERAAWLSGAPNPDGKGTIPNITPGELDWSAADIAYYFETGFTPDFDSVGGHMASVVDNLSKLSAEDRAAIAAYLKIVPAVK
ncbi:c-type cytochrome [Actibacterium lipolyticum]|uniref:Nicotinate dehydrogenase subunit B n=1 Tax=Actibacterium lipolyticum TaxID=1524263 RepID=A0A238JYG1_9RHOB|nr:cytochrome c [Actibacterium lipolyticum]SMX35154.1 Nicotinate dehydrogenase subunit B [Actibacterium lipolyticum]